MLLPLDSSITLDVYWQSRLQLRGYGAAHAAATAFRNLEGDLRGHREPHPGAARDHAALDFLEGLPDDRQARFAVWST